MGRRQVRACGPDSVVLAIPTIFVAPTLVIPTIFATPTLAIPTILLTSNLVIPTPNGGGICDTTAPEERNPVYLMASVPRSTVHERSDRGRGCSDRDSSAAFGVGMTRSRKVGSFSVFSADQPSHPRDRASFSGERPSFSGRQPSTRLRANHEPLQVGTLRDRSLGRPAPENL
jgi:hypothetical protein